MVPPISCVLIGRSHSECKPTDGRGADPDGSREAKGRSWMPSWFADDGDVRPELPALMSLDGHGGFSLYVFL